MDNPGHNGFYFITTGQSKNRPGSVNNDYKMIRLNYYWYWRDLKQALLRNGIKREDFATHDLRRCFARRAWEKYKDIHVLQGLLHHKNADTTLRYLAQSGLKNIDYLREMQSE
jgi:site-specific recombinase XerD